MPESPISEGRGYYPGWVTAVLLVCAMIVGLVLNGDRDTPLGLLALLIFVGPPVALYFLGKLALRHYRDATAAQWPTAPGEFDYGGVDGNEDDGFSVVLGYKYGVNGKCYVGFLPFERGFRTKNDAWDILKRAKGQPVTVHFKPENPSVSRLLRSENEHVRVSAVRGRRGI